MGRALSDPRRNLSVDSRGQGYRAPLANEPVAKNTREADAPGVLIQLAPRAERQHTPGLRATRTEHTRHPSFVRVADYAPEG